MASDMTGGTNAMSAQFGKAFETAVNQARAATEELTRMFGEMKLPALPDTEALLAAHRRNLEALTDANRAALEGAQAVARRHMEISQQTLAELAETMRSLATIDAPQAKAARQAELLKRAYERAVTHARELSELIQTANTEALQRLNRRFVEAVDELKTLVEKSASTKPE